MNSVKALGSRHAKESHGRPSLKALAKQLGIDPAEMGDKAEQMWSMLDDMAENDPEKYDNFVQTQFDTYEKQKRRDEIGPHFFPTRGIVAKAFDSRTGVKVFINLTSSPGIAPPTDGWGNELGDDLHCRINGMSVPLLVGDPRVMQDAEGNACLALDVVFNPFCIAKARVDNLFKCQCVDLALDWIDKESADREACPPAIAEALPVLIGYGGALKLRRQYKFIRSIYKGGDGEKGDEVVPFRIKPEPGSKEAQEAQEAAAAAAARGGEDKGGEAGDSESKRGQREAGLPSPAALAAMEAAMGGFRGGGGANAGGGGGGDGGGGGGGGGGASGGASAASVAAAAAAATAETMRDPAGLLSQLKGGGSGGGGASAEGLAAATAAAASDPSVLTSGNLLGGSDKAAKNGDKTQQQQEKKKKPLIEEVEVGEDGKVMATKSGSSSSSSSSGPLIEELDDDGATTVKGTDKKKKKAAAATAAAATTTKKKAAKGKRKGAVKKGFLNKAKGGLGGDGVELYPEGSGEGGPKTFMDRCKIVDTTKMTPEETKKAVEDYSKPGGNRVPLSKNQQAKARAKAKAKHDEMLAEQREKAAAMDTAIDKLLETYDAEARTSSILGMAGNTAGDGEGGSGKLSSAEANFMKEFLPGYSTTEIEAFSDMLAGAEKPKPGEKETSTKPVAATKAKAGAGAGAAEAGVSESKQDLNRTMAAAAAAPADDAPIAAAADGDFVAAKSFEGSRKGYVCCGVRYRLFQSFSTAAWWRFGTIHSYFSLPATFFRVFLFVFPGWPADTY